MSQKCLMQNLWFDKLISLQQQLQMIKNQQQQQQKQALPQIQNNFNLNPGFELGDDQKQGRWSENQNIKYCVFVSFNIAKFECKKKRLFRLYKPLSKFVITRTSQQCRSHHRKLLQRFKTPKNIVKNLQKQLKNFSLLEKTEQCKNILENILIPIKKSQRHNYIKFQENPSDSQSSKEFKQDQQRVNASRNNFQSELPIIPVPQIQTLPNSILQGPDYSNIGNWNYYAPQFYWNYFYSNSMPNIFYR